jgi:CTP synthase (UTP-ammonia lyase)
MLGTCGGYQHVVLEYARSVLGFADAAHAEYDPYASELFITVLSCSLVRRTMTVAVCQWPPTTTLSAPPATFNPYPYPDPAPT